VGGGVFIIIGDLEHKPFEFDREFAAGLIKLPDNWTQAGDLKAGGTVELLDQRAARTIRVRGSIKVDVHNSCARCLEGLEKKFDSNFELLFQPMETIARSEEKQISHVDNNVGFYEENGIELIDVVREQLQLWLPMRILCREDCKGICALCGANLNQTSCDCREEFVDPRWDSLRHMKFEN